MAGNVLHLTALDARLVEGHHGVVGPAVGGTVCTMAADQTNVWVINGHSDTYLGRWQLQEI